MRYLLQLAKKEYIRKNYSLDNIKEALKYLGEPHKKLKNIIHVTGTNGKGSVVVYTSKILHFLGYNVGTYISPHIFKVNERIQYNNTPISDKELKNYFSKVKKTLPKELFFKLTYFELLTCIMFLYFKDKSVDFVVLEVGLGGKLDATNVIEKSLVSCITSISLDHTEVLGKTEFEILKDKSAIIKPNSIFVCGKLKKQLLRYVKSLCKKLNTKFVYVANEIKDIKFNTETWRTICKIKFLNKYYSFIFPTCSYSQPYNFLLSLKIIEQLYKAGLLKKIKIKEIEKISATTQIPFRMQKVNIENLEIVVDGAHNPAAVENFVKTLKKLKLKEIVICFTLMKEKNYKEILKILSSIKKVINKFIIYELDTPRAQNVELLYTEAKKYFNKKLLVFENQKELKNYLKKLKQPIFFVGSFYVGTMFS